VTVNAASLACAPFLECSHVAHCSGDNDTDGSGAEDVEGAFRTSTTVTEAATTRRQTRIITVHRGPRLSTKLLPRKNPTLP
jgi:hypothetical protein